MIINWNTALWLGLLLGCGATDVSWSASDDEGSDGKGTESVSDEAWKKNLPSTRIDDAVKNLNDKSKDKAITDVFTDVFTGNP